MNPDRRSLGLLAVAAALLALTYAAYSPGLSGPLVLDDLPQLNALIKQSGEEPAVLFGNYLFSTSGPLGRPVAMMTFVVDAVAHGPDIWWWKYDNLLLHLISGLLAFWLAALLVKASPTKLSIEPWTAGLVVGGLWLLHPLQVSTVLYTVQRMTELSTLFVFAALISYTKGRLVQETSKLRGWLYIAIGFGLFFPLAALSKESGLLFPVYCTLLELIVFRFRGATGTRRQLGIAHGLLGAAYLGAAVYLVGNFSSLVLDHYAARSFTFGERVLTEFRILVRYLFMLIAPVQRNMGFYHDDVRVSTGLFDPVSTAISALALVGLLGSAVYLRRKSALYAFGILFFFASHALESTIFGLELMFEHRNYPGSFGIMLALVALLSEAVKNRRALAVGAVAGICAFSFLTWQRSLTWSGPGTMFTYMQRVHPQSPRLNILFAGLYSAAGQYDNARKSIDRLDASPDTALHRLLIDCLQYGRIDADAIAAVTRRPLTVVAAYTTSTVELLVREVTEGRCDAPRQPIVATVDFLLRHSPVRSPSDKRDLLFSKAELLESISDVDAAVDTYVQAQDLVNTDALPLYRAADMLARHARPDEARSMLRRALELEQTTRVRHEEVARTIYAGLADFYVANHRPEEALTVYGEAIQAMPDRSRFYVDSAELMLRMGRRTEAQTTLAEMDGREPVDADQFEYEVARIREKLAQPGAAEPAQ